MPSAKALFSMIRPSRTISTSTPSRSSCAPVASTPWNGVPVNVPRASQRTAARSSWTCSRGRTRSRGTSRRCRRGTRARPPGRSSSTCPRTFSPPARLPSVIAVSRSRRVSASKYASATRSVRPGRCRPGREGRLHVGLSLVSLSAGSRARMASRAGARKRELGRGERVLPGVWRLRLPLPWPGVPHCNAWALAAGDGIVLVDTRDARAGLVRPPGAGARDGQPADRQRAPALCTHAHSDHYGQAATIIERTGCELWMHPNHEHMTRAGRGPRAGARAADGDGAAERRAGRAAARLRGRRRGQGFGIAADRRARQARSSTAWRSRPTSGPGRSSRRRVTRPRTSACTRRSAGS